MNKLIKLFVFILFSTLAFSFKPFSESEKKLVYSVCKINRTIPINSKWDKPQWENIKTLTINNYLGNIPAFQPSVEAKICYNKKFLFVIFRVKDRYVRCVTNVINGRVWEDSCVEFFFATDQDFPLKYFNLEVNCGGTALMRYNIVPRKEFKMIVKEEIEEIKIAHSLPQITEPERLDTVTWTLEYRIPFSLLKKYSNVTHPQKGATWKANLYKIADKTSNRHYISWSPIENGVADFHQPQYFGELKFE